MRRLNAAQLRTLSQVQCRNNLFSSAPSLFTTLYYKLHGFEQINSESLFEDLTPFEMPFNFTHVTYRGEIEASEIYEPFIRIRQNKTRSTDNVDFKFWKFKQSNFSEVDDCIFDELCYNVMINSKSFMSKISSMAKLLENENATISKKKMNRYNSAKILNF